MSAAGTLQGARPPGGGRGAAPIEGGQASAPETRRAGRRVAVTGVGLVTPVGNDVATTWQALLEGRSGGGEISLFDAREFSTHIAAEVKDFRNTLVTDRKIFKFTNRSHRFMLEAAEQAFVDAGIRPTPDDAHRWGCAVGAGMMTADFDDLVETHAHCAAGGEFDADRLLSDRPANDPLVFCRGQATEGLALLTRRHGIQGYATSVHTACASGGQALGTALKLIRRGRVDRVLAGGFDSMISPVGIAGFCLLSALSPDNATPHRASRPFDATRNGFLLGEGAGFLVLEEWEAARARGARIYAELAGDGNSLSSYRITDSPPDGDGPIQAMRQALADACATTADIDYINAHGTSTGMNDRSESAAIRAVFGADADRVSVSSTKSTMGHLIAAAGAVEGVVCALAIARGEIPINANLAERDPDCNLNLVVGAPRRGYVRMTMSNSFGFGGSNSCIVMRHPEEVDARAGRRE